MYATMEGPSFYPIAGSGRMFTAAFATCNRGRSCPVPSLPPLVRPRCDPPSSTFGSLLEQHDVSHPTIAAHLSAERNRRDPYLPPDPTDPPDNPLFELVASVSSLASAQIPLPIGGGISFGYLLFLASTVLILPTTTSALLGVFFVAYWYLGRSVAVLDDDANEDGVGDEDSTTSDLLALVGAIASAGLLSPDGLAMSAGESAGGTPGMGIGLLALGSIAIVASVIDQSETQKLAAAKNDDELENANRKLMDFWDNEFDKKSKSKK